MALDQETINAQLDLLAVHRRTLAVYLRQQAQLGVLAPPGVVNGIAESQNTIRRIKEQLRADGLPVEDEPNDEVQPPAVAAPSRLSPQEQRNRRAMLTKVKTIWIDGLLEQSLAKELRIALALTEKPDAIDLPLNVQVQELRHPPRELQLGTPIIEVFDQMHGALLILGAPGAGKTTLVLELARDLIARAEQDEGHPIPIVFNLSTWGNKRQPLMDWLVEELNTKYDVPRKLAQAWMDAAVVLPLLDGLDEVPTHQRGACVEAINSYRQEEHGLIPLAVCSRIADYETLTTKLRLQGAIIVQPLTPPQIEDYFERVGDKLAGVRVVLRHDTELGELLTTPLMLSTTALAYAGRAAADVPVAGTSDERRRHLFDAYIEAMFTRRGKETRYTREQTVQVLSWLAGKLVQHNQTVFYIEWMQLTWLPRWQRNVYQTSVRLLFGLLGGLIGGLAFGLAFGLVGVLFGGLIGGLISGLGRGPGAGLSGGLRGLMADRFENIKVIETLHWSWSRDVLVLGLVVGLLGGLFFGLFFGLGGVLAGALVGALTGGMGAGLGGTEMNTRTNPNQGIHRSARSMVVVGLVGGLSLGFGFGLAGGLGLGFGFGLAGGLGFGMDYGGRTAFQHYTLRWFLSHNGSIPFRLVPFLGYCVDRIFLRKVGGGYIFVHRLLMEHFASLYTEQPAAPPSDRAAD